MKTLKTLVILGAIVVTALGIGACGEDCDGMGTLKLTNTSHSTIQRMMVDGVNYGSLDPNESEEIDLAAGEHDFQLLGISGGTGCSAAKVIIVACETTGFSCSN